MSINGNDPRTPQPPRPGEPELFFVPEVEHNIVVRCAVEVPIHGTSRHVTKTINEVERVLKLALGDGIKVTSEEN